MAARAPPTNTRNAIDKAETMRNPHDLPMSQLVNCCPLSVTVGFSDYLACVLTSQSGQVSPAITAGWTIFEGGVSGSIQLGTEAYGTVVVMITVFILSYVTS